MSFFQDESSRLPTSVDPYADPVSYLAGLGIEAELIEVWVSSPEAA
jgi:hypothetical protein